MGCIPFLQQVSIFIRFVLLDNGTPDTVFRVLPVVPYVPWRPDKFVTLVVLPREHGSRSVVLFIVFVLFAVREDLGFIIYL